MPRVTHVKKARKDNPAVKAGESYYWWKFNFGPMRYSATPPKQSQLTQSPFLGEYYSIQEDLEEGCANAITGADLTSTVEEVCGRITELRDETEGNFENIPENFQEGDTGTMLQERIDGLEQWQNDLETVDIDIPDADHIDAEGGDITDPAQLMDDAREELTGLDPGLY